MNKTNPLRLAWLPLTCALVAVSPDPAQASSSDDDLFNLPLSELMKVQVTTASKLPRSLVNSPGVISVYSRREIDLFGGRTLEDVLNKITGVHPTNDAGNGRYLVAMRGDTPRIDSNHVLILLNGIPINRDSYTTIWLQSILTAIPLSVIKQIEVIRGPGSVLYGTNAMSGVINIITEHADALDNAVTLEAGNNNSFAMTQTLAQADEYGELIASMRLYDTEGERLTSNTTLGNEFGREIAESVKSGIVVGQSEHFYGALWYGDNDTNVMRGTEAVLFDGEVNNEKYFLNGGYRNQFNDWTLKLDLSYVAGRTDLYDAIFPDGIRYETDDSRFEAQAYSQLTENTSLVLGATVDYFAVQVEAENPTMDNWYSTLLGAYAQLEHVIGNTHLVAGLQYNDPDKSDSKTVPRLALIHHFTPHWSLKLMGAQAFRAPSAVEANINAVLPIITLAGNSDINYELITTYDAQLVYNSSRLQLGLTRFRTQQDDLIERTLVAPGRVEFTNAGELVIDGWELESKYLPGHNWYLSASATWQENHDENDVDDVSLNPDLWVKAGVGYEGERWSIGLFDVYSSGYQDNIVVTPNRTLTNPESEAYHFFTLNTRWRPWANRDIDLSLYIENLLDEEIYIPRQPGFTNSSLNTFPSQLNGRAYLVGITWVLK